MIFGPNLKATYPPFSAIPIPAVAENILMSSRPRCYIGYYVMSGLFDVIEINYSLIGVFYELIANAQCSLF